MFRLPYLIVVCFACAVPVRGQQPSQPAAARSHVERFSTPQVRAERTESEATAKLAASPDDAEALNARSLARMRLGRYREAYDDIRRAAALKPSDARYRANLGYALWKIGRHGEALDAERAALKLDDKNFTAHFQLGRFLLRTGDPKLLPEAAAHLRRALELDPRQYDVRFELIAVYRLLGDTAKSVAQADLLQDARPSDPRVKYVAALVAADRGDMDGAVAGFREALGADPTLYGAWQDLGLAYVRLKRWPQAVETFAELSRRQADSSDAAYFHALSLYNTGRAEEAEREARRALRLAAGSSAAHTLLGIILASRGGANVEAAEALTQAATLDPQSFDAHLYLGRVQYAGKDYAGASRSLRRAVELNPRHEEARFFLGTVLEAGGESEAALAQYQELVKANPDSAFGQVGLGALLVRQGKTEEAVAALRRAVALDAKNFEAHLSLGRALALASRFAEAVESLQTAVALAPERADAHYQLGLALRRAGRADEAAREFAIVDRLNAEFRTSTTRP